MAERQWIRLDVDFEDSDWLVDLNPLAQFAWVKFCCRVKAEGTGGRWRKRNVTALRNRLALPGPAISEMLAAATAGDDPAVIEEDGDWVVTGWDKYYPTDRTNADRQRRWRERQKVDEPNTSNGGSNTHNAVTTSRATVDDDVITDKQPSADADAPDRSKVEPKKSNGRQTWLTPYADEWTQKAGGDPNFGALARSLKSIEKKHGQEATLRAWTAYLDKTDPQFYSPASFASKIGHWLKASKPAFRGYG